jgi:hypothetical protein
VTDNKLAEEELENLRLASIASIAIVFAVGYVEVVWVKKETHKLIISIFASREAENMDLVI